MLTQTLQGCRTVEGNDIKEVQYKLIKINRELRVELKMSISVHTLSMTIDTGAQISILKPGKLYDDTKVRFKEKVQIMGISKDAPLSSIGRATIKLQSEDYIFEFGFHIVTDPLNIDTDGLIGSDFLELANGIINYKKEILMITMNKERKEELIQETNETQNN